jgi:hypothetical protein
MMADLRINIEDAERILIRWIREKPARHLSNFGYDVYLSNVIRWHLEEQGLRERQVMETSTQNLWPTFVNAAWELCRRGVIRPGVREFNTQSTPQGSAGEGYSVTPFGKQWAAESDRADFVPTEPQRFAQMLAPYTQRFGPGFYERAQEAIRCYGAHAYLACCAMCGASAESILLAAAIAKRGEEPTLKKYASSLGRSRVQADLLAHVVASLQQEFNNLSILLKYWRDEAAHGMKSGIAENEAYTSLALLLRLAQFVDQNWDGLISDGL